MNENISFDDLIPSKGGSASTGSSLSFDDLLPRAKKDRTADIQKDVFKEAAKGSLSNLESAARGAVAGIPAMVGIPGSASVLGQKGVNIAAEKMGFERPFDEKTRLPEAGPIFEKTLQMMPRVTKTRPETKGMEELGSLYSPNFAPGAALTTLKGVAAPIKAGGKAVEFAQKASDKPSRLGSEALRKALPGYTGEAEQLLGRAESAQTLAERARRSRQESSLRGAEEKFTSAAKQEREATAAKFADLGQPTDPAVLGDDMSRRLTGTEFTRGSRREQQASRDYANYFQQAEGFETSTARNLMLNRLDALSKSSSAGSAGRKYAAQAFKDLSESDTAMGAEKEFRKYFEQASAPQQAGYGAIEQDANRAVSDIISEALNTHAPARIEARTTYKEFSTPLDAYETLFGKKGVARETKVPDRLQMMPSDYPSRYFKNRDTVAALREQLAGDEAAVRKFGIQHAVNELSGKNASQAQDWLDKNLSWVDAIPGLNDRVKRYVYELAKSEKTEKGLGEKVSKLETKRGEIVSQRQKTEAEIAKEAQGTRDYIAKELRNLELLDAEKVPTAAKQLMEYMSDKQLLPPERLKQLKLDIDVVNQMYEDKKKAGAAIQALLRKAGLYSGLGLLGAAGYYGVKSFSD